VYLHFYPESYRTFFFIAFIPGLISVFLLFLVKEKRLPAPVEPPGNFFSFFGYWKKASPVYQQLVIGLLYFALFNSSDIFLLLRTNEITGSNQLTIMAYVFYNLVFALASYPMGVLADKLGTKKVLVAGLLLFVITYAGFAVANEA